MFGFVLPVNKSSYGVSEGSDGDSKLFARQREKNFRVTTPTFSVKGSQTWEKSHGITVNCTCHSSSDNYNSSSFQDGSLKFGEVVDQSHTQYVP